MWSLVARRLIRLYPRWWRWRYTDEMADLLLTRPPTWRDVFDLAVNVLYTDLHPDLALTGNESAYERLVTLMRALRSSEVVVFCAFTLSIIAWLQFGGLVDGGPYQIQLGVTQPWPLLALDSHNALSMAMDGVSAGVDLAMLAALIGGVPLVVAAWRRAPRRRWLFFVPFGVAVALFIPIPIAAWIVGPVAVFNLTFTTPVTIAYLCSFLLGAGVSVWAVVHAVTGSMDASVTLLRFAFIPTVMLTGALFIMLGATLAWGVIAHQQAPHLFDQASMTTGYATVTSWGVDTVLLAIAALVALGAMLSGFAARTAARTATGA